MMTKIAKNSYRKQFPPSSLYYIFSTPLSKVHYKSILIVELLLLRKLQEPRVSYIYTKCLFEEARSPVSKVDIQTPIFAGKNYR